MKKRILSLDNYVNEGTDKVKKYKYTSLGVKLAKFMIEFSDPMDPEDEFVKEVIERYAGNDIFKILEKNNLIEEIK